MDSRKLDSLKSGLLEVAYHAAAGKIPLELSSKVTFRMLVK